MSLTASLSLSFFSFTKAAGKAAPATSGALLKLKKILMVALKKAGQF